MFGVRTRPIGGWVSESESEWSVYALVACSTAMFSGAVAL